MSIAPSLPRLSCTGVSPRLADSRYPTPTAAELADDVLERFLRYVQVDTQSDDDSETYPSTAKQLDLGKMLAQELREIGLEDVELTEHGYVFATLSGSAGPTVGLIAHMDTSSDESGTNVKPQVIRNYDGGDIVLPGDPRKVLRPSENPILAERAGHDIVTTDGTTLLGGDDKAGVAEIMGAVTYLAAHPEIEHAPIRVGFTVDEEVGRGVDHFDIDEFGADFAYTLDGSEIGRIDDETFSASEVRIRIEGHSVHPGTSKGKMVNAIKLAARIVERLPREERSPETTEGREGFVHPTRFAGTTAEAELRFIARDFDAQKLAEHEQILRKLADEVAAEEPRAHVTVTVEESYRNMKEFLDADPAVTEAADEAARRAGMEPWREPIRGGTDGSMLSARGLLTPNIFTGAHQFHSVLEWASVQDMAASAATIVELVKLWADPEWLSRLSRSEKSDRTAASPR
jgi:tripeptide aminopeptidase